MLFNYSYFPILTADVTANADSGPALARRLTFNQLVFHKVLGKGSFGKVGHVYQRQ